MFALCCEASLNETIAIYCADFMDNRVNVTQQLYSRISNARSKPYMIKEPMFLCGVRTCGTWQRTPINWFLLCIKRLFHTSSTQKSGTLRTCCGDSFSHLYSTTSGHRNGTKVWDLTGNLLINSRMWAFRNVIFQKCRYESYRDSYRTRSAQAFSSHLATWASLFSKSLGTMRRCRALCLHNSHLT